MRIPLIPVLTFLTAGALPCSAEAQGISAPVLLFDSLTWRGGNGLELATISGDPAVAGAPYEVLLRLAPGRWIPPHWHPRDKRVLVLTGVLRIGFGDRIDSTTVRSLPPGSSIQVPGNAHHYEGATGTTVVLLSGIGPLQTSMVAGGADPHQAPPIAPAADAAPPAGAPTVDSLRAAYVRAYNLGDADAMVPLYAADATRMAYDARAEEGRDAIVAGYRRTFAARTLVPTLTLLPDAVQPGLGSVVERGRYHEEMRSRTGSTVLVEDGKYVSVMERGADGRWRYSVSIFNRNAPPAPRI